MFTVGTLKTPKCTPVIDGPEMFTVGTLKTPKCTPVIDDAFRAEAAA